MIRNLPLQHWLSFVPVGSLIDEAAICSALTLRHDVVVDNL